MIRYDDVPEYYQLRQDFLIEPHTAPTPTYKEAVPRQGVYRLENKKQKVLS